ncbi:SAM-dependent methyltransferase, partial [Streptomyces sp. NPDC001193]
AGADLRKPQDILAAPVVAQLLDLERPVALLLVAVLHFLEDSDDPYAAVAELRDALAPGSLLVVTHASYEGIPLSQEVASGTVGVYRDIRNPLVMRSGEQIGRFFDGFELVEPGVVFMPLWHPEGTEDPEDGEAPEDPYSFSGFGGVGRKA